MLGLLFEAYRRFPEPPEVQGLVMIGVGDGGLVINTVVALMMHRSLGENLNVAGAFIHVVGDLLGSIGMVVAGIFNAAFGWFLNDPIFTVVISLIILVSSARLL